MTAYRTMATVVLLTSFSLDNVWRLGSAVAAAASKSGEHPSLLRISSAGKVYGTSAADEDSDSKSYSENSSEPNNYDSGSVGDDDDDDDDNDDDEEDDDGGDDGYTDSKNSREHEDQLDQDDPVSTVTVTAVRGSVAWLPCNIGGGDNDGLPRQIQKVVSSPGSGADKSKDTTNTIEDRAYMVLWFKHQPRSMVRHLNHKSKIKKMSSGGKPLYSFDVRGRPMDDALKWSSDEDNGGFGPRASFVVFGAVGRVGIGGVDGGRSGWRPKEQRLSPDDLGTAESDGGGGGDNDESYDDSSKAALRVANVTEQDAGAYRCRVDFRDSPTRNYRIILRVIVPPDRMTIAYNGEREIGAARDAATHHVVGPVPEGGRLILVCRVQGGKPKPRVQWYSADGKVTSSLNSETIDLTEDKSFDSDNDDGKITIKKLVIYQLNRSHANSTYTCLAGNDDNTIESNLRMTVLINMYLNVKNVRIVGIHPIDELENTVNYNEDSYNNGVIQGTNLISGKWYTGECWAEGASPKATIEWSIDGNGSLADEIPSSPATTRITVIKQTEHSSRIRFRPTPSDDGRYLRCRAWNPDINTTKDNIKNKALLLNVQYPPIVKLSLGHTFDPSRIKTGDDVYFECKVLDGGGNRGKQRNRIEWYHNGHPILQNGSSNNSVSINSDIKVVLLSAGTLVIRNVGRRHSGRYTCQCSNDLGMGHSRPVTLRVQYAPVCADDGGPPQLVGVEKNENSVHVTCRVRADPADDRVQFEWLVWPGAADASAAAELHQQQSPSVVATGNYVTTALSGQRNETATAAAAGTVVGELVLPATTVGVPLDMAQYADRTSNVKKPVVFDTVSCSATNAVGRQQNPCLYHIVPASPPGPLMGCEILMPKDQDSHLSGTSKRHHHRRASQFNKGAEDKDTATVSCDLENDGGVRPVTYSLEIYESSVLTSPFIGSTDETADVHSNKYRGEWLADNVTGTAVGNSVEYRVNRKNLRLRIGLNTNRKYLSLSAYASNRMGRGPQTYFDSGNAILLRHPWWWRGEPVEDSSTKVMGPAGTSSTEWWIMLSGGSGDERHSKTPNGRGIAGDGKRSTAGIAIVSIAVIATIIGMALIFLWKLRGRRPSTSTMVAANTTMVTSNLIGTNGRVAERGERPGKKYSLLSHQQQQQPQPRNIYPNLSSSDRGDSGRPTTADTTAPDIMIQQNYGKQFLVSIANRGIPGPESCV